MHLHKRFLLSIFVAFIPLIVLIVFIAITQQSTIFDKHPWYSDEIVHWAQPAAFREAGLNNGYFTNNEKPARLPQFRYFSWGPASPIFYGVFAYFIGWTFYTPLLINFALLGIMTVAFVNITRLSGRQIAWLAVLLATYPPLVMYAPIIMLEVLSYAIAVGLAILFAWIITQQSITPRHLALAVFVICLVSTIRATWSVLFIPLFVMHFVEKPTWRRAILDLVATGVPIGGMFLLYLTWSSPYPNVRNTAFDGLSSNFMQSVLTMVSNTQRNIRFSFVGNAAQLVMRLQLLIIAFSAVFIIRTGPRGGIQHKQNLRLAIICTCGLLGIFMFEIVGHDVVDWRDYRVFAPYVLFAMLLILVSNRLRFFGVLIGISLISYIAVWPTYLTELGHFNKENSYTSRLENFETEFQDLGIRYDANADSGWCNTIFYTNSFFVDPAILLAFDDGMGLTLLNSKNLMPDTIRSRYILFDDSTIEYLGDRVQLKLLLDLPDGGLYENLDADCSSPDTDSNAAM
jgi:hypothetical protein